MIIEVVYKRRKLKVELQTVEVKQEGKLLFSTDSEKVLNYFMEAIGVEIGEPLQESIENGKFVVTYLVGKKLVTKPIHSIKDVTKPYSKCIVGVRDWKTEGFLVQEDNGVTLYHYAEDTKDEVLDSISYVLIESNREFQLEEYPIFSVSELNGELSA
jgi:hypothetical protein